MDIKDKDLKFSEWMVLRVIYDNDPIAMTEEEIIKEIDRRNDKLDDWVEKYIIWRGGNPISNKMIVH